MKNWKEIWEKINFQSGSNTTLIQKLIWMNGFNSPLGGKNGNFLVEFYNYEMPGFAQSIFRFDCLYKKIKS